jgi:hypothetical protein
MPSQQSIEIARRGQELYDQQWRTRLEATHPGRFVAIEPESGGIYLAESLSEAIQAARTVHPDRLVFALRVGHRTTVDLGVIMP